MSVRETVEDEKKKRNIIQVVGGNVVNNCTQKVRDLGGGWAGKDGIRGQWKHH